MENKVIKRINTLNKYMNNMHVQKAGISHQFLKALIHCFPPQKINNFQGVFTLSNISQILSILKKKDTYCCIFNLCTENEAQMGTVGHYVAFVKKKKYALYLDPYGLPVLHDSAKFIISRLCENVPLYYNKKCVQSINSTHCGMYVLLFILCTNSNGRIKQKIVFSDENTDGKNDSRCMEYLYKFT